MHVFKLVQKNNNSNIQKTSVFTPRPHESGHFKTRILFIRLRVDKSLNRSWEWFQNNAVSVSRFTGFVLGGRKVGSCKKSGRSQKYGSI